MTFERIGNEEINIPNNSDQQHFEYLLNHSVRRLRYKSKRTIDYVNKLIDITDELNTIPSSLLAQITSHKCYISIRNLIRDLLQRWYTTEKLSEEESYLLRNCVLLFNRLVHVIEDVTRLTSWLFESSFLTAFINCLTDIDRVLSFDDEQKNFKQLTRLFEMFSTYYQRLPTQSEHRDDLHRLCEATMDCLASSNYDRIFRKLKFKSQSMNSKQTFFLITCPSFLTTYHQSQSKKIIEQLLDTMIPRYASILAQQIQFLKEWKSPIIHAIHHLFLTVIHAKGHYGLYATGQPIQWLIDSIVQIISEPSLIKKVKDKPTGCSEHLLIDSALRTLVEFVHEPDLLGYMKELKLAATFRSLLSLPSESMVIHAYVMLAYTLEEDDIKASGKDAGRFLSNIFDLLRKKMKTQAKSKHHYVTIERHISLLVEAVQVLVQHDQIKSEILKQNALSLLVNSCQHFNHRSKRLLLESIGSITFYQEAARLLRENTQFINSVEDMRKTTDDGIHKAAEKIIWNLEPDKVSRRKSPPSGEQKKSGKPKKEEYQYDIMLSYCHSDKEMVYRIHKFLADKGFKIWFDRDNIYGPAMQAMAEAVENSDFVIICMSDAYKRSVYCQAEAEYAFRCKRRLLPLIVRQGYRADGWLGLLISSRVYIDFGRLEYKAACELLLKEITLQRENQPNMEIDNGHTKEDRQIDLKEKETTSEQIEKSNIPVIYVKRDTSQSKYRTNSVEKWTKNDILDFLYDSNLHYMMPLCEFMTGHGLIQLFRMCQSNPSRFFRQLNDELTSRHDGLYLPIGVFTQFLSEIDQLVHSSASSSSALKAIEQHALRSNSPSPSSSSSSRVAAKTDGNKSDSISISPPLQQHWDLNSRQVRSSSVTSIQRSRNVHITEQTAIVTEPIVAPLTQNSSVVRTEYIKYDPV